MLRDHRVLLSCGHEITVLSEAFDPQKIEGHFGHHGLFDKVKSLTYPSNNKAGVLGSYTHLIHHLHGQKQALRHLKPPSNKAFDLVFSTQDAGYIPNISLPVIQWGYFPTTFPRHFRRSLPKAISRLPLQLHYEEKISRIGLVLAISQFSRWHFDKGGNAPASWFIHHVTWLSQGRNGISS